MSRAAAVVPAQPEASSFADFRGRSLAVTAGAKGRDVRSGTASARLTAVVGASVIPADVAGPSGPGTGCG